MRLLFVAMAVVALSTAGFAQSSMTLPVGWDTMDATGATAYPFNNSNDHIWQWHYAASNFAGVAGPITITDISIRASSPTSTVGAFSFPSVDIYIGSATTGYQVGQHDPVFANNTCTDLTLVRTGSWAGGPVLPSGTTTASWFSMGPVTTPFVFDPGAGRGLIVQIVKCGTTTTLGASIDGPSGPMVFGNRYGDINSCASTASAFQNNEFVPVVKIDYVAGGTPGICLTEYQTNQASSTLTVNGAPDPGGGGPITAQLALGATASVDISSTLTGNAWDIGFNLSALSIGLSSGGVATAGGQSINMNLADPGFTWLNNSFLGTGFANTSLLLSPVAAFAGSAQMGVVDPAHPDGIAASHAIDVAFVPCGGSNFDLLGTGAGVAPPGWTNPSGVGTPWTVNTGGTPSAGTGPTAAASGANYAYCETSGTGIGATFSMDTCAFDLTTLANPTGTLTFSLSRIGGTVGTLELLVDDGSGVGFVPITDPATGTPVTYTGPDPSQMQGATEWSSESVPFLHNIATSTAAIRFLYTAGASFTGDIGLDDIAFN